jgi:ubiquinone/menaquinone biosynthesis C-methylase UbiE
MKLTEAIDLIRPAFAGDVGVHTWADLGCGTGLFTKALASLLGPKGKVYAVDNGDQMINQEVGTAAIEFIKADFIYDALPFSFLDGMLMANSLHYVKDKSLLIGKLRHHLLPNGRLIIIEYDTTRANTWVPYPISFDKLSILLADQGFDKIKKTGERSSIYRSEKIYACLAEHAGISHE